MCVHSTIRTVSISHREIHFPQRKESLPAEKSGYSKSTEKMSSLEKYGCQEVMTIFSAHLKEFKDKQPKRQCQSTEGSSGPKHRGLDQYGINYL